MDRVEPGYKEFLCDVPDCNNRVKTELGATRPKHWATFWIGRDLYDFQDQAVARGDIRRMLCAECSEAIVKLMNEYRRKPKPHKPNPRDDEAFRISPKTAELPAEGWSTAPAPPVLPDTGWKS